MISLPTHGLRRAGLCLLFFILGVAHAGDGAPGKFPDTPVGTPQDFDGQHGSWHTTVRRLLKPLEGSQNWAQYEGTTIVHPMLGGRANVAELDVSGPAGRIQGLSVRLFDTAAKRWSIRFANVAAGILDDGIAGGFGGGRHGVFYGADTWKGRPILVRFVIDVIDARTVHFEQSFSENRGADWEVNWIAVDERL